jgi:nucleolar protein 14
MGKKRPNTLQKRKREDEKPNLFESIYNRKKFNVLGKKQKGERKHAKARSEAVNKVSPSCALSCGP